jgi:cytochrome b subunit of formate dehydrogenase
MKISINDGDSFESALGINIIIIIIAGDEMMFFVHSFWRRQVISLWFILQKLNEPSVYLYLSFILEFLRSDYIYTRHTYANQTDACWAARLFSNVFLSGNFKWPPFLRFNLIELEV